MAELEHAFKFNDAVLRHLTVKKKADTGPSSMMKTSSAKKPARPASRTPQPR
jgi:small subunit ribosomal protein S6